jgi:hypothetical protein
VHAHCNLCSARFKILISIKAYSQRLSNVLAEICVQPRSTLVNVNLIQWCGSKNKKTNTWNEISVMWICNFALQMNDKSNKRTFGINPCFRWNGCWAWVRYCWALIAYACIEISVQFSPRTLYCFISKLQYVVFSVRYSMTLYWCVWPYQCIVLANAPVQMCSRCSIHCSLKTMAINSRKSGIPQNVIRFTFL